MNLLVILLLFPVSYYVLHCLVATRLCKQERRQQARSNAVHEFRSWVLQLEHDHFYRTGDDHISYLNRLPPYETMLEERLPLKLDTYFHDSEIRKLLGVVKEPIE